MMSATGTGATDVRRSWRPTAKASAVLLAALAVTSCSLDGLLKTEQLPPDLTDPAITKTPAGALTVYRGAIVRFQSAFGGRTAGAFVGITGRLTDELDPGDGVAPGVLPVIDIVDRRALLPQGSNDAGVSDAHSVLQVVRSQTRQAVGLLRRYVPEDSALAGHMYALSAYAELFLAELFCSGIPLSTLDFDGDYTFRPGSTTAEVFTHALALFDTALTLAADSARFDNLIRVGQGRALLALGQHAAAAAAVAAVPDNYSYAVSFTNTTSSGSANAQNFTSQLASNLWGFSGGHYSVADRQGGNGLDYRSSGDPRTRTVAQTGSTLTLQRPLKYHTAATTPTSGANAAFNGSSPIVLASGIEARLIEAEAALQAGDAVTWLAKLNALRQTMWPTIRPPVTSPLVDLADPGTPAARVDLTFRERAFWLFLTGHRQGDLRRLIRQYGRTAEQVYPTGTYPGGGLYGTDVVAPIPAIELERNPLYTGCASTGA